MNTTYFNTHRIISILIGFFACGFLSLSAQSMKNESDYQLKIIDDVTVAPEKISVSPDGKYIAGSKNGNCFIHDTHTGETTDLTRTDMGGDYVGKVTSEGMVVGRAGSSEAAVPAYKTLEGAWTALPNNAKNGGSCDAASDDGSLLGGNILHPEEEAYIPSLWIKGEDGYELLTLPYPDPQGSNPFTGAKVVDISEDGSVILGLFTANASQLQNYPIVWKKEGDSYQYTEYGKAIGYGVAESRFFTPVNLCLSGDGRYITLLYTYLDMAEYFFQMFQQVVIYDLESGSDTHTMLFDPTRGEVNYMAGDTEGDLWNSTTLNDGTSLAYYKGKSAEKPTQGLVYDKDEKKFVEYKDWLNEKTGIDIFNETELTLSGCPFASSDGELVGGAYTKDDEFHFYYLHIPPVIPTYTIVASITGEGSIEPEGEVVVNEGDEQTFSFAPGEGYEISEVLIDEINNPEAIASGTYTFENITSDHTIAIVFTKKTYTIAASVIGEGGSISPNETVVVSHGDNQAFTFTPTEGYEISEVLIDGTNNAEAVASGSYTFENITSNHTIAIVFTKKTYTIAASVAGEGGSISPNETVVVSHGDNQAFTFTPAEGYEISEVLIDGTNNAEAVASGSYTFENVTSNHTIAVKFTGIVYEIIASAGENGDITPKGSIKVNYGSSQTFVFEPETGYKINKILIDNIEIEVVDSYTFPNVKSDHTISVTFKKSVGIGTVDSMDFAAYPNPTTGYLTVKKAANAEVKVMNSHGQLLMKTMDNELNIEHLPAGVYFLNIDNKALKIIKK